MREKGDLLWAIDKSKHFHPIVFLESLPKGEFSACVLSSRNTNGNIPMQKNHFLEQDEQGKDYTITYKNSHLVLDKFSKDDTWINSFEPKGKLSESGIAFVEKHIEHLKIKRLTVRLQDR